MIFVGGGQGWFGVACVGIVMLVALPSLMRAFFGFFDCPTESGRNAECDQSMPPDHINLPETRDWSCTDRFCRTHNPAHARFCRTCGKRRPPRELFNKVA